MSVVYTKGNCNIISDFRSTMIEIKITLKHHLLSVKYDESMEIMSMFTRRSQSGAFLVAVLAKLLAFRYLSLNICIFNCSESVYAQTPLNNPVMNTDSSISSFRKCKMTPPYKHMYTWKHTKLPSPQGDCKHGHTLSISN